MFPLSHYGTCVTLIIFRTILTLPILLSFAVLAVQADPSENATCPETRTAIGAPVKLARLLISAEEALRLGDYESAEEQLRLALKEKPKDERMLAVVYTDFADALAGQGKFSEALPWYRRASKLLDRGGTEYDASNCRMADGMAAALIALDDLEAADQVAQKCLEWRRANLKPDDTLLAASYKHIAIIRAKQGLRDQAEDNYVRSVNILKTAAPQTVALADTLECLASLDYSRGKSVDALPLFLEAHQIKDQLRAVDLPYAPAPVDNAVVYRFMEGSPFCHRSSEQSIDTFATTGGGVTVKISLVDKPSRWVETTRVVATLTNHGPTTVSVFPKLPRLLYGGAKLKEAKYIDAEDLAMLVEKRGQGKASALEQQSKNATTPVRTSYYNSYSDTRVYRTTYLPDVQKRALAATEMQQVLSQCAEEAGAIRSAGLKARTVGPEEGLRGFFDFKHINSKSTGMQICIPVGRAVFVFDWPSAGQ